MCRLLAITGDKYQSCEKVLSGLQVMQEGFDRSGFGLLLKDLGGPFEKIKSAPILSGIFSKSGIKQLDHYMLEIGFSTKLKLSLKPSKPCPEAMPKRDIYLVRAYDYPSEWEEFDDAERHSQLTRVRLELNRMGGHMGDMILFSFWPETILLKELGDPLLFNEYLNLSRKDLEAKTIMAQSEQSTDCLGDPNFCSPSFYQGFSTVVSGENTAFESTMDFLKGRGVPGYNSYRSKSAVLTYTLHYTLKQLGLGLDGFKHILTPLERGQIDCHPHGQILRHLKHSCRNLILDGPNCIIGCLPDNTVFMVQDRKKWRSGVIGNDNGTYVFSSDISGLNTILPNRDLKHDFQPMNMDIAYVGAKREKIKVYRQPEPLNFLN